MQSFAFFLNFSKYSHGFNITFDFKGFPFSNPWVRDDPIATGQSKTYLGHLRYLSKKEYFSINFSVFLHEKNNFEKN